MVGQHQLICRGLEEFAKRLQVNDCWVTFEANGKEHWLQCARGQINMDWPFSHAPQPQQLQTYFGTLAPFEVVAWDADLYVTINIAKSEPEMLVVIIDRVFRDFYDLGSDYELSYKLEDA